MNSVVLLIAVVLMWIGVIAGLYQRIFRIPLWFSDPPVSFGLIRKQAKGSRIFWILLTLLMYIFLIISLVLNWTHILTRTHIIAGVVCYLISGLLTGMYFVKGILKFMNMPADAPKTPELLREVKTWLRWTSSR